MNSTHFPLDINKPGYSIEVLEAIIKDQVHTQILEWGSIELPAVTEFLKGHVPNSGYDWENSILDQAEDMPIELLEKWVAALRGGFFRAQMRGILKRKKEQNEHTTKD